MVIIFLVYTFNKFNGMAVPWSRFDILRSAKHDCTVSVLRCLVGVTVHDHVYDFRIVFF